MSYESSLATSYKAQTIHPHSAKKWNTIPLVFEFFRASLMAKHLSRHLNGQTN